MIQKEHQARRVRSGCRLPPTHTHTNAPHARSYKGTAAGALTPVRGWASWSSWGAAWALCPEARSPCSSGGGGAGGVPVPRTTRTEELEREQSVCQRGWLPGTITADAFLKQALQKLKYRRATAHFLVLHHKLLRLNSKLGSFG